MESSLNWINNRILRTEIANTYDDLWTCACTLPKAWQTHIHKSTFPASCLLPCFQAPHAFIFIQLRKVSPSSTMGSGGVGGCNTPQYLVKMRSRATPCTSLMCIFRLYLRAVRWEQNWQENGFSPVWVMTCRCNSVGEPQITGQRWHLGTSVPPSQPSSIPSTYNRQNKLSQFLGQLGAAVGHQQRHPQQYTFPQE